MRIGVFGGTFDPVHFGHITTVEAAARRFRLDRIIYVPARVSPLKDAAPTDARHRVAMLALALEGRPDWTLGFEELDRDPPSYTVDTLRALSARHLQAELWLLMGTDTLAGLARWKEPEEIIRTARIGAFLREPFSGEGLRVPDIAGLSQRLEVFDAGSVRISASGLREALARGESAAGRVPGSVEEYITKHGLYRCETQNR
jgi:nicotinate-nucleotide adenylyltransferase